MALSEEARGILRTRRWESAPSRTGRAFYRSQMADGEVLLALSGVGREAALAAAAELLADYPVAALVSLGFAGALTRQLRPGTLVVAEHLYQLSNPEGVVSPLPGAVLVEPEAGLVHWATGVLSEEVLPFKTGTCLTVETLVTSPAEKRRLGQFMGALTVDMESYWLGQAASRARVPFLAVRAVLDDVSLRLPPFLALGRDGRGRLRILWQTILRPWWIPSLVAAAGSMAKAERSLTVFASAFLTHYAQQRVAMAGQ
ncbi:MAG: hypothetical protein HYY31_04545 [Chloroflexi bacterium]|nr:hypothetical protein [Chloroflexota bacterium]